MLCHVGSKPLAEGNSFKTCIGSEISHCTDILETQLAQKTVAGTAADLTINVDAHSTLT